jgi:hypothetical protein
MAATASLSAHAAVIHLKNGDSIYADEVEQGSETVRYQVGDNSFTIPRSKVQDIEVSQASPAIGTVVPPVLTPELESADPGNLLG